MRKIGSGVQFNVYDIGNGRVRKIPTSFIQKLITFHKIAPKYHLLFHPIHNIKTAIGSGKMTISSIEQLQKNLVNIDPSLIGNPLIMAKHEYEQDKVLSFADKIRAANPEGQKKLVDGYVDHILSCWDYGFSDTVFNFMVNSGLTNSGDVLLIDLGELTWSKDEVADLVREKHWEKRSSYNKLWDIGLKKYLQQQFNKKITLTSLNQHWNSMNVSSLHT